MLPLHVLDLYALSVPRCRMFRVEVLRQGSWRRLCNGNDPSWFLPIDAGSVCRALGWIGGLPVLRPTDSFGGPVNDPPGLAYLTRGPRFYDIDSVSALWDASGLSIQDSGSCPQAAVSCSAGTGGESAER
jgi:hypothetical protein